MIRNEREYRDAKTRVDLMWEQIVTKKDQIATLRREIDDYVEKQRSILISPVEAVPPGDLKLTGPELARWSQMSRAARWQFIRVKRGLCASCGQEPLVSTRLGLRCLTAQRERMRQKTGAKRRNTALSYEFEARRKTAKRRTA